MGRVAALAGAIEGLSTVVWHSRRNMGIVGVSKGLGISFVMRERKNKRLQRSGGLNGQRVPEDWSRSEWTDITFPSGHATREFPDSAVPLTNYGKANSRIAMPVTNK